MKTRCGLLILASAALVGCGGQAVVSDGGSSGGTGGGATRDAGTARIRVNVESGDVLVTQLAGADSRAVFSGGAVGVSSSRVLEDAGELTRRAIEVTLRNNTQEPIGYNGGFRVILEDFENLSGLSTDYRADSQVSTPASGQSRPYGVEADENGTVYFSQKNSGTVKKMVGGSVSVAATGFSGPAGLAAISGTDHLIVAENSGNVISVTSRVSGGRTVLAGTGAAGSADGPAGAATFSSPDGVAVDSNGNIYVADAGTSKIRMISDPFGTPVVSTLVSSGLAVVADIEVMSIAGTEYLVVASKNSVQGVALPGGQVFPIAGSSSSGNVQGSGDLARFKLVRGVDSVNGAIFVVDSQNYRMKQITLRHGGNPMAASDWHVAFLAGTSGPGHVDGAGYVAQFEYSQHIAASLDGHLYVAEYSGDSIREIEGTSSTLPFLGSGGSSATEDVQITNADGYISGHVTNDYQRRPYFDSGQTLAAGQSLQMPKWAFLIPEDVTAFEFTMSLSAEAETRATLPGVIGVSGTGFEGSPEVMVTTFTGHPLNNVDLDGPISTARIKGSPYLDSTADGLVFGARDNRIFVIKDDIVTTISGGDAFTSSTAVPGVGLSGSPGYVYGFCCNADGTMLFTSNAVSDRIYMYYRNSVYYDPAIPSNWTMVEIAGTTSGFTDGDGSTAQFANPYGVVYDSNSGWLYVADLSNNRLRKLKLVGADKTDPTHWIVRTLGPG
jgi:hypothetical protein